MIDIQAGVGVESDTKFFVEEVVSSVELEILSNTAPIIRGFLELIELFPEADSSKKQGKTYLIGMPFDKENDPFYVSEWGVVS